MGAAALEFAAYFVEHDTRNTGIVVVGDDELAREDAKSRWDLRRLCTGAVHFHIGHENRRVGAHLIKFFLGGVERVLVLREFFVPDQR